MITYSSSGSSGATEAWLKKLASGDIFSQLDKYGRMGQAALSSATPVESGETAGAWNYEIKKDANSYSIIWGNTHIVNGAPIAVMLQVGHGTGTGGYVAGRDYINPALQPIFDQIESEVWKAVTSG